MLQGISLKKRESGRERDRERETDRQKQRYFTHSGSSVYDCEWVQVRRIPVRACCQQTLILSMCDCETGETERDRAGDRGRLSPG